jgi:RHS repeat-associated protein
MTYPSGLVVSYGRDTQGRIITVSLSRGSYSLPLVTSVSYMPFGPIAQIHFGNGQSLTKSWDQNYWPDAIGGNVLDYAFTTDDVGNIIEVASASEGTQKLGYDRLDRLNEVRDANLALIEAYTYDATGNRLSQQIGNNPVIHYSYPAQSHRLIQVGAAVRSFDAAGNTLTGVPGYEADSATYDARNRLTQVGSGSSAQLLSNYNGRGERVLVSQGAPAPALPTTSAAWTTSAGVRGYVYDESGQVISMLIAGNPLRYEEIIWLDHTPIGRVESSTSAVTAVHVIHSDHLNTPRALANAQVQGGQPPGTVVWRWKLNQQTATGSNAFGAQPAEEDPDGNGTRVRFDLRFPGQQYDAATGLHYNYFRDYEPGTGRYVESDPIGLYGGVSTFGYVSGNALVKFDLYGLAECGSTDCCERARQAGLDNGDGGGVVCCGGRKFACAWIDDNPWPDDRDARWILRVCTRKHEQEHFDETSCTGAAGPERPDRHADMNATREECAAYAVGLKCLRGMEANCRDLVNCPAQVQRIRRHWVNYANSTLQCRGLQNL